MTTHLINFFLIIGLTLAVGVGQSLLLTSLGVPTVIVGFISIMVGMILPGQLMLMLYKPENKSDKTE